MSNNIYDILSKLPKDTSTIDVESESIYENVDPRGDILEAVKDLEEKFYKYKNDNKQENDPSGFKIAKAKREMQLAMAEYPEASSPEEAIVARMGDQAEETKKVIDNAKATIAKQQQEIARTAQAVNDANARYDAQEKRFQEFNQQVAASELDVKQQAQAALAFAKQPQAQPKDIIAKTQATTPAAATQPTAQEKEPKQPATSSPAQEKPSTTGVKVVPPKIGTKKTATKTKTSAPDNGTQGSWQAIAANDEDNGEEEMYGTYDESTMKDKNIIKEDRREGDPMLGVENYGLLGQAYLKADDQVILSYGGNKLPLTASQVYGLIQLFNGMDPTSKELFVKKNLSFFNSTLQLVNSPQVVDLQKGFPQHQKEFGAWKRKQALTARKSNPKQQDFFGTPTMENINKIAESLMERFMSFKEEAKPDFLDLDKDGDTEEPMKSAAKSAKDEEPAKPDADAVAKRKRLQALKDKQEDERTERGDDDKSSSRVVKGRAYGGAAQKDDEEKDDLDEVSYSAKAARAGKDIGKPGKAFAKIAKSAGERYGSKERGEKVAGAVLKKLRANEGEGCMDEVAPPGAKAERMVKHIKKGYAKDGKLTPKEKSIAYATAWKAKKAGKLEESRNAESSEYTYEKIGRVLCDEQPGLDVDSEAFVKAVYDELIEMKLTPKAARWLVHYDEDFLSDCATSYNYFCQSKEKEMAECGAPMNSFVSEEPLLDAEQELDEIAKLAGLAPKMESKCSSCGCADCKCDESLEPMVPADSASPLTHTCEQCGMMEDKCCCKQESMVDESAINEAATRKDFRAVADLLKNIEDIAKRTELALHHADVFKEQNPRFKKEMFLAAAGVDITPIKDEEVVDEAEVGEGNEFSGALAKAKAAGEKEFEVDGKKYTVKEDININVSATGEEDVVNLIRKLSGMPVIAIQAQSAVAEEIVAEEGPKERDVEYTNTPREEVAGTDAAIPSGTDLNRAKKSYSDKPFRGDNPMAVAESKEEALWRSYEEMLKDVKA